ncbi:poly-gamma-glutamate capsule biosynthesis protein CapA/YwtB (metallophosphatase superfamily) [Oxalobacteraceae bacterium GrIS 1.11]
MMGHRNMALAAGLTLALAACGAAQAETAQPTVSIAFVGDIMLDEAPGKVVKSGRDPFAPLATLLDAADIRVGNLECVVATKGTPEPDKPYTFRAHPRTLTVLKRHFDALALANNHSGDYGPVAFGEMLDLLDARGIAYFGGGRDLAGAHQALLIERKGLRIALLSYNEFFPRSFEADFDKPGIAWSEDEQVRLDIGKARSLYHADLVIPVMHWGWEYEPTASARQRQLARLMIDAGADAVVGGHPHVLQDVEQYKGKPIIYSLGNFLFNGFDGPEKNTGWLLRMELDREGVRAWRSYTTRIDREGVPHPAPQVPGSCWGRGQDKAAACGAD